jgi:aspartyl-tRNA(Asn)/glutamyl-tRNA(Gln) amidotransferase subunit A
MPLSYTQDHVGPLAATIENLGIFMGRAAAGAERPIRAAIPRDFFFDQAEPEVRSGVSSAASILKPREIRIPEIEPLIEIARVTLLSEAAAILSRYSTDPRDFGEDVWALIEKGRSITAAAYIDAQVRRHRLARDFSKIWAHADCLITPATPFTAFPIQHSGDPRPAATRFTRPFNLLGWPALSLPCGFSSEGLPIGMQIVAAPGREDILLQAGGAIEAALKARA